MAGGQSTPMLITQAESKRVVALLGHLRQIFRTACPDGKTILRPVLIDQSELVLASASLRALLFDDSAGAMLLEFCRQHDLRIPVGSFDTTSSMLFLSELEERASAHISDLFISLQLNEDTQRSFPLDKEVRLFAALEEGQSHVVPELPKNFEKWTATSPQEEPRNVVHSYQPGLGAVQLAHLTRRIVDIADWGELIVGYLKSIPIRRRTIILYVANKLGGVHYDSKRLPSNATSAQEFRALAEAYDWNQQAVTHAGYVAVAIACVELLTSPLRNLYQSLGKFHEERQTRLRAGKPLTAANPPSSSDDSPAGPTK